MSGIHSSRIFLPRERLKIPYLDPIYQIRVPSAEPGLPPVAECSFFRGQMLMRLCGYKGNMATTGVVLAAERLGLNEFELFETAYRACFQVDGSIQLLERHFVLYLFEGHVPYWVHQYLQRLDPPLDIPLPASTWYRLTPRLFYLFADLICCLLPLINRFSRPRQDELLA